MLGFLKIFVQGILYVVFLPLIVVFLAIYCVYGLAIFVYMAIKAVIVFFMGGTPLGDLPEDVEAKRILLERSQTQPESNTQALAEALIQSQIKIAQDLYSQQNNSLDNQEISTVENENSEENLPTDEETFEGENND